MATQKKATPKKVKAEVIAVVLTKDELTLAKNVVQHLTGGSSLVSQVRATIEKRFGGGSAPIQQNVFSKWSRTMAIAVGKDNSRAWAKLVSIAKGDRALIDAAGEDVSAKRKAAAAQRSVAKKAEAAKKHPTASNDPVLFDRAIALLLAEAESGLPPTDSITFGKLCARLVEYHQHKVSPGKKSKAK